MKRKPKSWSPSWENPCFCGISLQTGCKIIASWQIVGYKYFTKFKVCKKYCFANILICTAAQLYKHLEVGRCDSPGHIVSQNQLIRP